MNLRLCVMLMSGLLLQSGGSDKASLVAENGASAKFTDGVLDLKSGRGWLRTRQVFLETTGSYSRLAGAGRLTA